MWVKFDKFSNNDNAYLSALGRAMALAQHFEHGCKRVLAVFDLAKSIKNGVAVDFDDWAKNIDEFVEERLGRAVLKFGSSHSMAVDKLDVLQRAKEARNYLSHKAALFWPYEESHQQDLVAMVARLQTVVTDLAAGENLVSTWAYSIEEKGSSPPWTLILAYEQSLVAWIMEPLASVDSAHDLREISAPERDRHI